MVYNIRSRFDLLFERQQDVLLLPSGSECQLRSKSRLEYPLLASSYPSPLSTWHGHGGSLAAKWEPTPASPPKLSHSRCFCLTCTSSLPANFAVLPCVRFPQSLTLAFRCNYCCSSSYCDHQCMKGSKHALLTAHSFQTAFSPSFRCRSRMSE